MGRKSFEVLTLRAASKKNSSARCFTILADFNGAKAAQFLE